MFSPLPVTDYPRTWAMQLACCPAASLRTVQQAERQSVRRLLDSTHCLCEREEAGCVPHTTSHARLGF